MNVSVNEVPRHNVLTLSIRDTSVLYAAYMPFIKHGGLFIPTIREYELGDEVLMSLNLMDEVEKIPATGRVVWVTPRGAQGNRAAGVGVQFSENDAIARNKIETYLAGVLASGRPTHTM
ncbi:MAG: PilZ domain-containing protein [Pseudomonas sp.]|nr:PilZ domain-containing protein [Pseudomonas sp.]